MNTIQVGRGPLGYVMEQPTSTASRIDVLTAIQTAGTTQAAIASYLGVTPNSVSRVICGTMRSTKIEAELEKITGKPLHADKPGRGRPKTVWPGTNAGAAA